MNEINLIVKESYSNLRSQINKEFEEQYGALNINAKIYVPKNKILNDSNDNSNINMRNNNYGGNYENNFEPQNFISQYYQNYN